MRIFGSRAGRVLAWVWWGFAGLNFVDLAVRGRDRASLVVALVLLLTCGIAYVLGVRPRVRADERGVAFDNPFRTTWLPWGRVRKVTAGRTLGAEYDGGRVESWAVQVSARKAAAAARADAKDLASRTPVTFAAEQLEELRAGAEDADGAAYVRWSVPALAAVLVPLAAVLVAALL